MSLEVEGRGVRSICFRQLWVFLKLNFHLPLSCFDLDLEEDMCRLLPSSHHSVIILYTMKDNLHTKLHFFWPPPPLQQQPLPLSCQSGKGKKKQKMNKRCHHSHRTPSSWAPRYYSQTVIKLELNLNQWNSKDCSLVIHWHAAIKKRWF